jgi:formate/nitrite transporter FocA (FNT family)
VFKNVSRLWITVLAANLAGALIFTWVVSSTDLCTPAVRVQLLAMSDETVKQDFATTMLRGIFAGWLIALMIWLLPFAESAHIWIIVALSYLLGIGHLPHIIAGAVPSLYAVFTGGTSAGHWFDHFFLPVLIGNCIGGVTMVAMMVHAEFVKEAGLKPAH